MLIQTKAAGQQVYKTLCDCVSQGRIQGGGGIQPGSPPKHPKTEI
jgi:hypothetical protein